MRSRHRSPLAAIRHTLAAGVPAPTMLPWSHSWSELRTNDEVFGYR
jgi:hypothetical protein